MKSSQVSAASVLAFAHSAAAAASYWPAHFGNSFSTGPVADNTFIREANTTLVLPATQSPQVGNLGLWPGIGTDTELVQGLAISTVYNGGSPCGNIGENWCLVTSTLVDNQEDGKTHATGKVGDKVTYSYKWNDATSVYDQAVLLNGVVISTLSIGSSKGKGWGTAEECQAAPCGLVAQNTWLDTVIVMDVADPNYDSTVRKTGSTGDLVTADGGKTWTVAQIVVDAFTYSDPTFDTTTAQVAPPEGNDPNSVQGGPQSGSAPAAPAPAPSSNATAPAAPTNATGPAAPAAPTVPAVPASGPASGPASAGPGAAAPSGFAPRPGSGRPGAGGAGGLTGPAGRNGTRGGGRRHRPHRPHGGRNGTRGAGGEGRGGRGGLAKLPL